MLSRKARLKIASIAKKIAIVAMWCYAVLAVLFFIFSVHKFFIIKYPSDIAIAILLTIFSVFVLINVIINMRKIYGR